MEYQWYPGHMTKARRMMEENIRLVDLVIELVDARIPLSSRNPDIDALCEGKGRIVILCKADLADPEKTKQFIEYFKGKGILAVSVDARERKAGDVVRRYVQEACREKIARDRARGIVGRPLRAMVAGIPNVGKSTFINSFAGRASAKTGNKPGVTRGKQWIRMGGSVELLDTPGILWPKFDNREIGMRLALVGAIREEILDRQELAVWLLAFLEEEYPGFVAKKYLTQPSDKNVSETESFHQTDEEVSETEILQHSDEEETEVETLQQSDGGVSETETLQLSDEDASEAETLQPSDREVSETETLQQSDGEASEAETFHHTAEAVSPYYDLLLRIAGARKLLMKGGEPDAERAAAMLIDDSKNGRIGLISLDRPGDAEAMEEERKRFVASREEEKSSGKKSGASGKGGRKPGSGNGTGKDRSPRGDRNSAYGEKSGGNGKNTASGDRSGGAGSGRNSGYSGGKNSASGGKFKNSGSRSRSYGTGGGRSGKAGAANAGRNRGKSGASGSGDRRNGGRKK